MAVSSMRTGFMWSLYAAHHRRHKYGEHVCPRVLLYFFSERALHRLAHLQKGRSLLAPEGHSILAQRFIAGDVTPTRHRVPHPTGHHYRSRSRNRLGAGRLMLRHPSLRDWPAQPRDLTPAINRWTTLASSLRDRVHAGKHICSF